MSPQQRETFKQMLYLPERHIPLPPLPPTLDTLDPLPPTSAIYLSPQVGPRLLPEHQGSRIRARSLSLSRPVLSPRLASREVDSYSDQYYADADADEDYHGSTTTVTGGEYSSPDPDRDDDSAGRRLRRRLVVRRWDSAPAPVGDLRSFAEGVRPHPVLVPDPMLPALEWHSARNRSRPGSVAGFEGRRVFDVDVEPPREEDLRMRLGGNTRKDVGRVNSTGSLRRLMEEREVGIYEKDRRARRIKSPASRRNRDS